MFDFAIAQHQKHRPSKLLLGSSVLSVVAHAAVLVILIENPQLLAGGWNHWLRQFPIIVSSTSPIKEWRTVAVMPGRMQEPSAETLRKYVYDFNRKEPPVRVRWGKNELVSMGVPKPVPVTKPVLGKKEPKPPPQFAASEKPAAPGGTPAGAIAETPKPGAVADATKGGAGQTVALPPAETEPKQIPKTVEVAGKAAPTSIPNSTNPPPAPKPSNPTQPREAAKVAQNEQQVIRAEQSGLFDTKGFPLGEYASMIIERIKGNWSIPSNLRNAQGHTTVIFYIDKKGSYTNARIAVSSGNNSLDLAALNAVLVSNPFPPLPKGFPGDYVGAKFVFSYREP